MRTMRPTAVIARTVPTTVAVVILVLSCLATGSSLAWAARSAPTALSEVFAIERVTGGLGIYKWARNDIYVRLPNGKLTQIGAADADGTPRGGLQDLGKAIEGLRSLHIAISKDGRSLLFRGTTPKAAKLAPGIYQYVFGQGIKLLYPESDLVQSYTRWEPPFPPDALPFSYKSQVDTPPVVWAVRATGEVLPVALMEGSPLHWAAFEGRTTDCAALVAGGADLDARTYWGFTPLELAILRGQQETAIRLLELGANPRAGTQPAFRRAVRLGQLAVVRALLERGADPNEVDANGGTPLHVVVVPRNDVDACFGSLATDQRSTVPLLRLLLERGADPRLTDQRGRTPLGLVDEDLAQGRAAEARAAESGVSLSPAWMASIQLSHEVRTILVAHQKPG